MCFTKTWSPTRVSDLGLEGGHKSGLEGDLQASICRSQVSGLSWSHTMLIIDWLLISCLNLHLKSQTCRSHPSLSVQWHYVMKPQDLSVVFEHTASVQSVLHMLTCVVEVFRHVSPGHCSSSGSCRWDGHPTAGPRQHPLIFLSLWITQDWAEQDVKADSREKSLLRQIGSSHVSEAFDEAAAAEASTGMSESTLCE